MDDKIVRPRIEQRALQVGLIAYGDLRRDYTNQEPYIAHCVKTAQFLLMFQPVESEVIQAAFLQGVFARTAIKRDEIALEFGHQVAGYVDELTPQSRRTRTPLADAKNEIGRFAYASQGAQNIKAASLVDDAWHCWTAQKEDFRIAPLFWRNLKGYFEVMQAMHPALRALLGSISQSIEIHNQWPDPQRMLQL
jgi:hypothetical protein